MKDHKLDELPLVILSLLFLQAMGHGCHCYVMVLWGDMHVSSRMGVEGGLGFNE